MWRACARWRSPGRPGEPSELPAKRARHPKRSPGKRGEGANTQTGYASYTDSQKTWFPRSCKSSPTRCFNLRKSREPWRSISGKSSSCSSRNLGTPNCATLISQSVHPTGFAWLFVCLWHFKANSPGKTGVPLQPMPKR